MALSDHPGKRQHHGFHAARVAAALVSVLFTGWFVGGAKAQPPGTVPSLEMVQQENDNAGGELPVKAFFYLDEIGIPNMMPLMTMEKMDEFWNGAKTTSDLFKLEELNAKVIADADRAKLDIEIKLSIDPTGGQWVSVPLKMGNFHMDGAPEFSSVPAASRNDAERLTPMPEGKGYQLMLRSSESREIVVKLKATSLVKSSSVNVLDFQFPVVSTSVVVETTPRDVSVEISGLGTEVLLPRENLSKDPFTVVSSGGSFQFSWGPKQRVKSQTAKYEVQQDVQFDWKSPEESPLMTAQWRVKSSRESESVSVFAVELPPAARLEPKVLLRSSEKTITPKKINNTRYEFTIPEEERRNEIDVSLSIVLNANNRDASGWFNLRVPQLVGAIRQEGEITINTVDDYRLRWRAKRGVQRILNDASESIDRGYKFSFDRGSVVLPIRLSAQQQQLRVSAESDIRISENLASLEMTILSRGEASDSRELEIDFGQWQPQSIVDADSGENLAIGTTKGLVQVSLTSDLGGEPSVVRIVAVHPPLDDGDAIQFQLPRVTSSDSTIVIESSEVAIRSSGRSSFVVDLSDSQSLSTASDLASERPNLLVSKFLVQPPNAKARVSGVMVQQPPQISLESDVSVILDGEQVVTTVNWLLASETDLEGRLEIGIPAAMGTRLANAKSNGGEEPATTAEDLSEEWSVTLNGKGAELKSLGNQKYELISDRMTDGTFSVQWVNSQAMNLKETHAIGLPRPRNADVEVLGDILVDLEGNEKFDLQVADRPSMTSLQFAEPPRDPIRVRLITRSANERDLSIERAVMRSAIGSNVRQEQVLAKVKGGEAFRVTLLQPNKNPKVEAFLDQENVVVRRDDDELVVVLPADSASHIVDLRVWSETTQAGLLDQVQPILRLPFGTGRVYWQVIVPDNAHVIWSAPTVRRAMRWEFDRWTLSRQSVMTDQSLLDWVGASNESVVPPGNSYLYLGSDISSFRVRLISRSSLWLLVGLVVLGLASLLVYVPSARNPMTAVVGAIAFAGLLSVAPDASILIGQFAMFALVLVVVMIGLRTLLQPRRQILARSPAKTPSNSERSPSTRTVNREAFGGDRNALDVPENTDAPSATSEAAL